MRAFLAERSRRVEAVDGDTRTLVAQNAARVEHRRNLETELFDRSRRAIAQSFMLLARVPDRMKAGFGWIGPEPSSKRGEAAVDPPYAWRDLLGEGVGDRYFFDIDDGHGVRRDEVGMLLASRDDIARETRTMLLDLAYSEIPRGHPREFVATVRNARGTSVYKGHAAMKPLPPE